MGKIILNERESIVISGDTTGVSLCIAESGTTKGLVLLDANQTAILIQHLKSAYLGMAELAE